MEGDSWGEESCGEVGEREGGGWMRWSGLPTWTALTRWANGKGRSKQHNRRVLDIPYNKPQLPK